MGYMKHLSITLMNADPMSPRMEAYCHKQASESEDFKEVLEKYYKRQTAMDNFKENYKAYQKNYKKDNAEKLKQYKI